MRIFSNVSEVAKAYAAAKADVAPLYVCRPVRNATEIIRWFRLQGFGKMIEPADMHVTVCFSRQPVSWDAMGDHFDDLRIGTDFRHREVAALGKDGEAAVLKFRSGDLQQRWEHFRSLGATWDWPTYEPHLTLSYSAAGKVLSDFTPFNGPILLGPERFQDINTDYKDFVVEKSVRRP